MKHISVFSAVTFCALLTSVAHAQTTSAHDFARCDGFGSPTEGGDGMTKEATGLFGLFQATGTAGNLTMNSPTFGDEGIHSCDAALSDAMLRPQYHLRRASLFRARGIHRLVKGANTEALADFDLADSEGLLSQEPFYERSMGTGNKLFRAYTQLKLNRADLAEQLASDAFTQRPFNSRSQSAALLLRLQASKDWLSYLQELKAMSAAHPEVRTRLFYLAMAFGDFELALAMSPMIDFSVPPKRFAGFEISDYELLNVKLFVDQFRIDAFTVQALAAQGQKEDALKLISNLRTRLLAVDAPLSLGVGGQQPSKQERTIHEGIQSVSSKLKTLLDESEQRIGLLSAAEHGDWEQILVALRSGRIAADGFGIKIIKLCQSKSGEHAQEMENLSQPIRDKHKLLMTVPEVNISELYDAIPIAETKDRLPKFQKMSRGMFSLNVVDGFIVEANGFETHVHFSGMSATASNVEEMALLKAAEIASEAGNSQIAIISKRVSSRSLNARYGIFGNVSPMGYSADVQFISFNPELLSEKYLAYKNYSLKAADVISALRPIYQP